MKVSKVGSRFVSDATFAERDIPKSAGFRFHWADPAKCRSGCRECADGLKKVWWTLDTAIASRLIQFADDSAKSDLETAKASQEASHAVDANIEIPVPDGLQYLPFQRAAIAYSMSRQNTLFGDEMGCVAGESTININRGGKGFPVTLQNAYRRFHKLDRMNYNWDSAIPTYCRSLCNGELRQHLVKTILYKGSKPVVRVALQSGKSVRVTPDHEVALSSNQWVEAKDLKPGDLVVTNGIGVCMTCGEQTQLIDYPYAKFRGHCHKCMYRKHRAKPTWIGGRSFSKDGYILVSQHHDHPRSNKGGQVYEHLLVMENHLGRGLRAGEYVHHKNGNRSDNRLENLDLVSATEHIRLHKGYQRLHGSVSGRGGSVTFFPTLDPVVSVQPDGETDVYDVVMEDPHRNFVANGIVVHNCGKTIEALGTINADASIRSVLVLCPSSLRLNWKNEATKWLVHPFKIKVIVGRELPETTDQVVILNYEKIVGSRGRALLDNLLARDWDVLIADECHVLKNASAKRTLAVLGKGGKRDPVIGLISKARRRLFLSGTPMLNRPIELWSLAHALAPAEFSNWHYYVTRYCGAVHNGFALDVTGASNLPELQERIRTLFLIRRLKAQVMTELPPKRRMIIELAQNGAAPAVSEEQQAWQDSEAYLADLRDAADLALAEGDDKAYKSHCERLKEGVTHAFTQIAKARHAVALAKVPACVDHITDLLDEVPKVVVFAHHRDVISKLYDALKDYGTVVITGDTKIEDRQAAVDSFQTDPKVRVFLGSLTAAGFGFTLTASSTVVFCETDWVPGVVRQGEDRCHRLGSTGEYILIQHLVVNGSLDARMIKTLIAKQEVADKALDIPYPEFEVPAIPEPVQGTKAVPTAPRAPLPSKWPVATEQEREAALKCLQMLAGVCDGAVARDDVGFNGRDARIGHDLAARTRLTDGQVWLAKRILPKYHRQLDAALLAEAVGKKD